MAMPSHYQTLRSGRPLSGSPSPAIRAPEFGNAFTFSRRFNYQLVDAAERNNRDGTMNNYLNPAIAISLAALLVSACGSGDPKETNSQKPKDLESIQFIYNLKSIPSDRQEGINCKNALDKLHFLSSSSKRWYNYYYKDQNGSWMYALRPTEGCWTDPVSTRAASFGIKICVSNDILSKIEMKNSKLIISTDIEDCSFKSTIKIGSFISTGSTKSSGSCSKPSSGKPEKYLLCGAEKPPAGSPANPSNELPLPSAPAPAPAPPAPSSSLASPVPPSVPDSSALAPAAAPSNATALSGYWNVYKSLKYTPTPAGFRSSPSFNEADVTRGDLEKCGVEARVGSTEGFKSFRQGLLIVYSGPFSDANSAKSELAKAKACGFDGYSKASVRE